MSQRIFLTGASGCIGHYMAEALIQETEDELFLLVRNPDKLKFDYNARPGITILQGDMRQIEEFADLLQTMDAAVLAATAWGDPQETYDINVVKTIRLLNLLNPEVCQQVIYFSTASILDRNNEPLQAAGEIGTDYIKTKYACHQQLANLAIAPRLTVVFPTLVFGGDEQKPYSHISAGLPEVVRWLWLIRFLGADGSFHFIHGRDIAQVIRYLLKHPAEPGPDGEQEGIRQYVLGNQRTYVNQAIDEVCAYMGLRTYFRIPLSFWLASTLMKVLRFQVAEWDFFSLQYRHFTHKTVTNPGTFGLPIYCPNVVDLFRVRGIPAAKK
ncbi:epimerase [Leptolyngbya sp. 'hensonii']|uniref:NAD-dependent epimerase/dehydratase family protein n=1 Tax=Leptolyngbya sp. 'hensonii' TaxID=1922337 RepID=UPI00094F8F15|nr:NAD(P)-dependent oxidoreductase [Leptolyngbya sp. 'hensonii']OLP19367.1 epimerase [Leptolyngbya sp. 'hensonii']